jgi:hypothetical protein
VRTKTIISGAITVLALATLTANAGNLHPHQTQGSVLSLVAATTAVARAERDAATIATRSTTPEQSAEPTVAKPAALAKPATPRMIPITPGCQQAINTLRAMHQAELTEEAAERAAAQPLSATALTADRTEDTAEAQQWRTALTAARTACLPQPGAACQAAITGLQTLLQANRADEVSELINVRDVNWTIDLASLRTAFAAVATACADRD